MISMIKKFLWDETAAKGYLRGGLLLVGGLVSTGQIHAPAWVGALLMAFAGMVRAGDKNR